MVRLANALILEGFGEQCGHERYEARLRYLVGQEWARLLDDVICFRTKLGMWLNAEEQSRVAQWLTRHNKAELSLAS